MIKFIAVGVVVLVLVVVVFGVLQSRRSSARELTSDELKIRELVHEVYGDNITSQSVAINDGDAVLTIGLQNENLQSLQINLSNLARKHRDEGVSLAVLKMTVRFE